MDKQIKILHPSNHKRIYMAPRMVRYGEISQLTAAGSAGASESAAGPSGMGCLPDNMLNNNCPPGGF